MKQTIDSPQPDRLSAGQRAAGGTMSPKICRIRARTVVSALTAAGCILAVGCAGVARVHRDTAVSKSGALKGIPFYSRVGHCVESRIYERRWSSVALETSQVDPTTGKPVFVAATGSIAVRTDAAELQKLREAVLSPQPPAVSGGEDSVLTAFRNLRDAASIDPEAPFDRSGLVAHTMVVEARVDYSSVHFLNSRMPWFGSSSVEAALAPDGALQSASAQSESTAAEALTSFVPLKEYLTSQWIPSSADVDAAAAANAPESTGIAAQGRADDPLRTDLLELERSARRARLSRDASPRRYRLAIAPGGHRWIQRREWRADARPCRRENPTVLVESLLREPISPAASADDGESITFDGRITLPESEPEVP